MQHAIRRHPRLMLSLLAACLATALAAAPDPAWLDARMPEPERALLAETEGFTIPALDGVEWVGNAPTPDEFKDKIIVIQSWTRASEQGRAVNRRVENLIERSGHVDDVVLVTVHTPEMAAGAAGFIERRKSTGYSAVDASGALCDELGVWKRPTTIVVDRAGVIRVAGADLVKLDEIIRSIAEETTPAAGQPLATRASRDDKAGRALPATPTAAPSKAPKASFPPITDPLTGANDLRGKKGPELFVQEWISKPPVLDNKVVMVEFWATWCGPCIKGIPHLNELAAAHRDSLVVVGVSDESTSLIRQFMRSNKMEYHVASDASRKMARVVGSQGIPHAIVMSPDGIVRWQGHPARLTDDIMAQIVAASGAGASETVGGAGMAPMRWSAE